METRQRRKLRGAALVEFIVGLPLLFATALAGIFFYELLQAKIKIQEASRFAAWEMTSFPLNDFGSAQHAAVFGAASRNVKIASERRFAGLRSVDQSERSRFLADVSTVTVGLRNEEVTQNEGSRAPVVNTNQNPLAGLVRAALDRPAQSILERWGFDRTGLITARTSARVTNGVLSAPGVLPSGGITLTNEFTLIASAWNLGDGADAMMRDKRAGNHRGGSLPHGLYSQIKRMSLLGLRNDLEGRAGSLSSIIGISPADPLGTYVVSHNFAAENIRDCNQNVNYTGKAGLNNSNGQERFRDQYTRLDLHLPKCFDTAPFQDTHAYRESLYKHLFDHRGRFFLGTIRPMTENPSSSGE